MFYTQLLKICEERGEKPSPLLKSLGYSTGFLKKWAEGATVNSEILKKLSDHFEVPVDYFLQETEENSIVDSEDVSQEINAFKIALSAIKAHPDYINSLITGYDILESDLNCISKYMRCKMEYLVEDEIIITQKGDKTPSIYSPVFLITEILTRLPGNTQYRILQVRISRVILQNLKRANICQDDVMGVGLSKEKITRLYNDAIPDNKKRGLNYSDVINIARKCNVSLETMLTGFGE